MRQEPRDPDDLGVVTRWTAGERGVCDSGGGSGVVDERRSDGELEQVHEGREDLADVVRCCLLKEKCSSPSRRSRKNWANAWNAPFCSVHSIQQIKAGFICFNLGSRLVTSIPSHES